MWRTTESLAPISDSMLTPPVGDPLYYNQAEASAGLFEVQVYTYGLSIFTWAHAWAASSNYFRFAPLADQTQTVSIDFSGWNSYFCSGSVALFDITSQTELWRYGWSGMADLLSIPWDDSSFSHALLSLETEFLVSHQYELTMSTDSSGATDSEGMLISLTGLQVIPEPSQAVERLIALVNNSGTRKSKPLTASLRAALSSIHRGNRVAAANQLHAFKNKVRAQVAAPALAGQLIEAAQQVIKALRS